MLRLVAKAYVSAGAFDKVMMAKEVSHLQQIEMLMLTSAALTLHKYRCASSFY